MLRIPTPPADYAVTLSNGVRIGGRLSVALLECKRRLETELPGFIDYVNAERNLTGGHKIPQFKGYAIAPAELTKEHVNMCLVGASVAQFDTLGSVAFKGQGTLTIYVLDAPIRAESQYLSNLDRAGCVRLLMANYLTDLVDLQGREVWKTLAPRAEQLLPEKWRDYSGVAIPHLITQPAGADLWAV